MGNLSVKIKLHESLEDPVQDKFYMIMDYASNGDLLEHINKHGFVFEDQARKMFRQMIHAIGEIQIFFGSALTHGRAVVRHGGFQQQER